MRFGILGPIQVAAPDGGSLPVGGARLRSALALLLADAGHLVPAQRLIDGVYGSAPPAGATNALQSQVSRLRQLLGDAAPVEFHPAGYRLAIDPADVDVHRFRALVADARDTADPRHALSLLTEALGLWRGPALADAGDSAPIRALATELEDARLTASEARIAAALELGDVSDELIVELRALVATHPLREQLRVHLIRALQTTGRTAAALLAFEDARRALADELGADPSAELRAAHLAVLREPDHRTPAPVKRLPAQLTSFVGRDEELGRLRDLLDAHRLVTLTGPGGAGKTRLAIEAAARRDGESCLIELATVRNGAEVEQVVLDALGLRDGGLRPTVAAGAPLDRLVAALADRPMLLILDNCEHVVDAAATLADHLLRRCPSLRALATSREPLGITGERLLPVRALGLAAVDDPLEKIRTAPAVQLFADRAAATRPDFVVDAQTAPQVLRICRMLDGQPLALELAAARLRGLPLAEVASRLDDRFRLLSRGERTGPARHRTLRAAIEWSWDLLDDSERTLARRLTVFIGGATAAAVDQVCGLDDADLLSGLVDKSLVELTEGRYRMLDTVRMYGEERLAESGELKQLRRAHAEYYLELALEGDARLRTGDQLRWAAILDSERDNLHAAVRWSSTADPALGLRLTAALAMYSWIRGRRGEFGVLARDLLEGVGPRPPHGMDEEHAICVLAARLAGYDGAWAREGSVWPVKPDEGFRPPRLPFLNVLAALSAGPPAESEHSKLEAWYDNPDVDPWTDALQKFGRAYMRHMFSADVAGARANLEESVADFRALGDRWGESMALGELADIADSQGEREQFLALNSAAMRLSAELNSEEDQSDLLCRRATSDLRVGELETAEASFRAAAELAARAGASDVMTRVRAGQGQLAWLRGDLTEAERLYRSGLAELAGGWYVADEARTLLLIGLGWVAYATGDAAAARERHRSALNSGIPRHSPLVGDVAEGLAAAAQLAGEAGAAATLLGLVPALRGGHSPSYPTIPSIADAVRAALGPDVFNATYDAALALTRDEAITELHRLADEAGPGPSAERA
ncbi:BTAD domain-containing putative transcriptional regulator [Cryptosporangium aurantiacum]|uniref:Predicted ATPase n=1 Tax=Cryptosporangium aurantiacum TaxID=134849 RepID=A0A1M7MUI8_9ACTN|nr:BTAD domain-containing putative transcriptional regulator [Cryptosporangium aurantiacum]SHM94682.1 Predicted ATPase [Cryptosporangium aurantiacum]